MSLPPANRRGFLSIISVPPEYVETLEKQRGTDTPATAEAWSADEDFNTQWIKKMRAVLHSASALDFRQGKGQPRDQEAFYIIEELKRVLERKTRTRQ
eukprot:COSAG04_NODE_18743_length_433_cov_1.236527_2_plen_97_part_01